MLEIIDLQKSAEFFMEYEAIGFFVALLALYVHTVKTYASFASTGLSVISEFKEAIVASSAQQAAMANEHTAALRAMSDAILNMSQEVRILSDRSLARARD